MTTDERSVSRIVVGPACPACDGAWTTRTSPAVNPKEPCEVCRGACVAVIACPACDTHGPDAECPLCGGRLTLGLWPERGVADDE